jgi:hypothetical protein
MKAETSLVNEPLFCNFLRPSNGLETRCEIKSVQNLASPYNSDVVITVGVWAGTSD